MGTGDVKDIARRGAEGEEADPENDIKTPASFVKPPHFALNDMKNIFLLFNVIIMAFNIQEVKAQPTDLSTPLSTPVKNCSATYYFNLLGQSPGVFISGSDSVFNSITKGEVIEVDSLDDSTLAMTVSTLGFYFTYKGFEKI